MALSKKKQSQISSIANERFCVQIAELQKTSQFSGFWQDHPEKWLAVEKIIWDALNDMSIQIQLDIINLFNQPHP